MYLGIFREFPNQILLRPAKQMDRVATNLSWRVTGFQKIYQAYSIMEYLPSSRCFLLLKDRWNDGTSVVAAKYYGLDIDADGYFRNKSDEVLFLLKYSGIQDEIAVDFPLI